MKRAETKLEKAERAVIRAAVGCVDMNGHAFKVSTEEIVRTYSINERAFKRLEAAVAKLKEARKTKVIW